VNPDEVTASYKDGISRGLGAVQGALRNGILEDRHHLRAEGVKGRTLVNRYDGTAASAGIALG
jgi:hypothetical protein